MADYEILVRGSVLDEAAITELEAVLKPLSISQLQDDLHQARAWMPFRQLYIAPPGHIRDEDHARQVAATAEAAIARGGEVRYTRWTVTDYHGIKHSSPEGSVDGPPLDRLRDYKSLRFSMEAAGATVGASFGSNSRYAISIASSARYGAPGIDTSVQLQAPADEILPLAEKVRSILEARIVPGDEDLPVAPFKVFIGHGTDPQWKYLQRALNDIHGILAEAFESSERAGFHTLSVVDQMVRTSTAAVVVMTGEDVMEDGSRRARENVVHEVGYCQGALGIANTIVVLEEGTSEPSNIAGLTQIRFPRGRLIDVEAKILEALNQRKQAYEFRTSGT